MITKLIQYAFGRPANPAVLTPPPSKPVAPKPAVEAFDLSAIPRYPPFNEGMPAVPVDIVLASQQDMITKAYQVVGLDKQTHDQIVMPVIRRLAAYAHLLPATRDEFYRGAGGLLRLSLDSAYHATRASESAVFAAHEPGDVRRRVEPIYKTAVFLGGLGYFLWLIPRTIHVTTRDGQEWQPFLEPLEDWLIRNEVDRYFVQLDELPHALEPGVDGATMLRAIIHQAAMQFLTTEGPTVFAALTAAVSGSVRPSQHNIIHELLSSTVSRILERDARADVTRVGQPRVGMHIEPYLVDAMCTLVANTRWVPNAPMGRVFVTTSQKVFLLWPLAGKDIQKQLADGGIPGIPATESGLLSLLVAGGLVQEHQMPNGALTPIIKIQQGNKSWEVVQLARPLTVWPDGLPDGDDTIKVHTELVVSAAAGGLPRLATDPPSPSQEEAKSAPEASPPKEPSKAKPAAPAPAAAVPAETPQQAQGPAPAEPMPKPTIVSAQKSGKPKSAEPTGPKLLGMDELMGSIQGRVGRYSLALLLKSIENGECEAAGKLGKYVVPKGSFLVVADRALTLNSNNFDTIAMELAEAGILRSKSVDDKAVWVLQYGFDGEDRSAVILRPEFLNFYRQYVKAPAEPPAGQPTHA